MVGPNKGRLKFRENGTSKEKIPLFDPFWQNFSLPLFGPTTVPKASAKRLATYLNWPTFGHFRVGLFRYDPCSCIFDAQLSDHNYTLGISPSVLTSKTPIQCVFNPLWTDGDTLNRFQNQNSPFLLFETTLLHLLHTCVVQNLDRLTLNFWYFVIFHFFMVFVKFYFRGV